MLFAILPQEQMGNDIECVEYIVGETRCMKV